MNLYKGLKYWGSKGGKYIESIFPLLPGGVNHMVEACMGSGVISANLAFSGLRQQTAFELDKGLYTLHKMIQNHPYELLDLISKIPYCRSFYNSSMEKLKSYNAAEVSNYSDLEIAQAEFSVLMMSFNAMRTAFRRLDGYTKYTDESMRRKSKDALERMKDNLYRDASEIVLGCNNAWRGLKILNEDFMDHPEVFVEGRDTLCFVDTPYMLSKRGIEGRKSNTGYMIDWDDAEQRRYLNFIEEVQKQTNPSKIIICSNFQINEQGEIDIKELRDDLYNQYLLPLGFRLVVVQRKSSSEIKNWQSTSPKKTKAEVVYINYTDILGNWHDCKYYDYEDVYGEKCGQELAV